ncbi:hypothetical protein L6270_03940 [Candidatus Parcubacteria bacterium]|nr:hypothetical protein [Patescibacteria group bacterium]MBU4309115.1 hypothetical protein [Patescibacteria group bacterium]MBU4432711.1 hypothetical protein [Patescibacteria group bacterium]MBU4577476.1 hypothetical protein [Patescibacteria group bacterium]MCG2697164.1 hypothetical protein [Candidatus Parcubacteria bacterium]
MFKEVFTIRKIKKLRTEDMNKQFLVDFRGELNIFMTNNPVMKKEVQRLFNMESLNKFINFNKLNFKSMPAFIIVLIALITTGGGVAAASQTSLPSDALYPVKILTEEVREAVTFNNTAKAKLHAKYANDRVEEVQKMLSEKGIDPKGLEIALANLTKHASQTASIIEGERSHGKNVNALAKELQNKIEKAKTDLENNLDSMAVNATSTEARKTWKEKIEKIKSEMEDNEDRIGKSEEFKKEAEAAMLQARKQLQEASQNGLASTTELIKFNSFMDKASSSISKEHWVQARQHAMQAEKALEKVENKIEKEEKKEFKMEKGKKLENGEGEKKGNGRDKDSSTEKEDDEDIASTTSEE